MSVGEDNYVTWIAPLSLIAHEQGIVRLGAPTNFIAAWVSRNYADAIGRSFRACGHEAVRVEVTVLTRPAPVASPDAAPAPPSAPAVRTAVRAGRPESARDEDEDLSTLEPNRTFDKFVVGKPNALAHAAARRVAEGASVSFNPLFLHGGVGLGKTHLMQAIAWDLTTRFPEKKVLYLSAEKFMYRFVQALRDKQVMDFKSLFRSVDVLLVDDIQFIAGKDSTQEEFFHTFNALIDQNRQIVLSGDRPPGEIRDLEDRITSRLQCGLVADLHPTDYELRLGILQAKAEQNRASYGPIVIGEGVMQFLAQRITSSVRALEGALNRLFAHACLIGVEITLDMAQDALADMLRSSERRVTVEEIQKKVAEHYNIRLSDMIGPKRQRGVARPRQVAMYLSKHLTSRSLPDIGKRFGGRDHTTILHGVRTIDELRTTDSQLSEDIEMLRRMLQV